MLEPFQNGTKQNKNLIRVAIIFEFGFKVALLQYCYVNKY